MRTHRPPLLVLFAGPALVSLGLTVPLAAGAAGPANVNSVASQASTAPDPIVGSWRPREYRLAAGDTLPVDGRIVFLARSDDGSSGEWSVTFFVTGEDGAAVRGSAEGGEWSREGRSLLLTHQFHLSAGGAAGPLPEAPLAMAFRSAAEAARNHREPCEVTMDGGVLTLHFPSGNSMTFERVEALR